MKLLNFDARDLIYQQLRCTAHTIPENFTPCQYRILCNLIQQKKIKKESFEILLLALFEVSNWRELSYTQMYELIFVLTNLDYQKVRL